jgi:hypothetical protein
MIDVILNVSLNKQIVIVLDCNSEVLIYMNSNIYN